MKNSLSTAIWFCILLGPGLAGCIPQQFDKNNGKEAIRLEQVLTCYNTNLGISFTVPAGWLLLDLNTANFSPDPEDTRDNRGFDIIYEADSFRMDLINFANHPPSKQKKYLGFEIYIESGENTLNPEQQDSLRLIRHSTELKTGDYLVILAAYWPENRNAGTSVEELIHRALTLTEPEESRYETNSP